MASAVRSGGIFGRNRRDEVKVATEFAFASPVLLADVGGTNARFALAEAAGKPVRPLGIYKTAAYPSFKDAALHALKTAGAAHPKSLLVDGAGPVVDNEIKLTNAAWRLEIDKIGHELGLHSAMLLNDFEALALALPFLQADGLRPIGKGNPDASGVRLVIGPGTGLGATTLVDMNGIFVPVPSECGMVSIGPVGPDEVALWPHIELFHGRIFAESLLSGGGLERLYRAHRRQAKLDPAETPAARIGDAALKGSDPEAVAAVRTFLHILARYAGDVALIVKATGGVYLAGGVLQRLSSLIEPENFRQAFEDKAPFAALMREIPTSLITLDIPAFIGLAAFAEAPERFRIAAGNRWWRAGNA